jgi:hypothetical protein
VDIPGFYGAWGSLVVTNAFPHFHMLGKEYIVNPISPSPTVSFPVPFHTV